MIKNSLKTLAIVIPTLLFVTACFDDEQADTSKAEMKKEAPTAVKKAPAKNTFFVESGSKDAEMDLQVLMHEAAQAKREAAKYGFIWSVTQALIDKGYKEAEAGHEQQAIVLFQEAIKQYKLSVEQAKYADQNWQMLVPTE